MTWAMPSSLTRLFGPPKQKAQWQVIHGDPRGLVELDGKAPAEARAAAPEPARPNSFREVEGVVEEFRLIRDWASYYWREDFTLVLRDDAGKRHRVISREPTPWTDLRLGTTYPGLKVDWAGKPRVRIVGIQGIDRQPAAFYDLKLNDAVITAFILRVQQPHKTWRDFYVNNWFHDWGDETNRKILPYFANKEPNYSIYGYVQGARVPFDDEGRKLLAKYDPVYGGIIYQGRIVPAKNDAGHVIQVMRLMGRHKKTANYEVFHGDPKGLIKLDGKAPAKPAKE